MPKPARAVPDKKEIYGQMEIPLAPLMRSSPGMTARARSLPLSESIAQKEQGGPATLFILDTCYVLDLAKKGSLRDAFSSMKGERTELVLTSQVLDELRAQFRRGRTGDDGRLLLDFRAYAELIRCVSEGLLMKAEVEITEDDRRLGKELLKGISEKSNSRLGEGELSMLVFAREMGGCFQCMILSKDSDLAIFGDYFRAGLGPHEVK